MLRIMIINRGSEKSLRNLLIMDSPKECRFGKRSFEVLSMIADAL